MTKGEHDKGGTWQRGNMTKGEYGKGYYGIYIDQYISEDTGFWGLYDIQIIFIIKCEYEILWFKLRK